MDICYIHMLIYAVLIQRINMYIHIYSSNYCLSFMCVIKGLLVYTLRFHKMFGFGNLV